MMGIGTILLASLGAYGVYKIAKPKKRKKKTKSIRPTPTPDGPRPPKPDEPETPKPIEPPTGSTTIETYESPYGKSVLYQTPAGDLRIKVRIDYGNGSTEGGDEAIDGVDLDVAKIVARGKAFWFGGPRTADDFLVQLVGSLSSDYRGAVWQNASEGFFSTSANWPTGGGWSWPFAGIDQSLDALKEQLDTQRREHANDTP